MVPIPLIGIILIVVIVILFFVIKRNPVVENEEAELYVLFNDPYFVKPHELAELLFILASTTDEKIEYVLCVFGNIEAKAKIPLEKYFSMYDYNCVITKTEPVNKDKFQVTLQFTKK